MAFDATIPLATNQIGADITAIRANFAFLIGTANYKLFTNAAGTAPEWASGIKISSQDRDISLTTDWAITGIGFKPSHVIFLATIPNVFTMSIGFDNGTNHYVMYQIDANTWGRIDGSHSIVWTAAAGNYNLGSIKTLDADGFTLEWAKTAAPTGVGNLFYMAFR